VDIAVRCQLELLFAVATPVIFRLKPQTGTAQRINQAVLSFSPDLVVDEFQDSFANICHRVVLPAEPVCIDLDVKASVAEGLDRDPAAGFVNIAELPVNHLAFLLPSRYCESDRLGRFAAGLVRGLKPGYCQAEKICGWIRENLPYKPGTSNQPLSALEVQQQGAGVCRDLAHLAIALMRGLSIPARYVVGYLQGLEPEDMHAWLEVYVGGRWYGFDPSQTDLSGGRVVVGYGRDAADVAITDQFGPLPSLSTMWVEVS
jgi:transglutaminase-like putative cysteine protease